MHVVKGDERDSLHFDTRQILHLLWTDEEICSGAFARRLTNHILGTVGFGPGYSRDGRQ